MKNYFGRSMEPPAYPSMYIIVFSIFLEQQLEKDATGCDIVVCTLLHICVHCANVIYKSCNDFNNLDSCKVEFYDTL
jgi:hypothetical protein